MGEDKGLLEQIFLEEKAINTNATKSIYAEDFQKVPGKRPDLIIFKPDYDDIISGPFIDPLLPDSEISKTDQLKWERANDIYNRVVTKYPSLKKVVLPEVVDQSRIISEYKTLNKSSYQIAYSHQGQYSIPKQIGIKDKIKISTEWEPLPITTQRKSYRQWGELKPWNVKPAKPFLPPASELGMGRKEQQILDISTGKSEYEESISDTGIEIMKYAFYGDVKILPREYRKK